MMILNGLRLLCRRFVLGDHDSGFKFLVRIAGLLYPGYRLIDPQIDWWKIRSFTAFLERFGELKGGALNSDRKWMVGELVRLTAAVPGDTAECGSYLGASSWLICHHNRDSAKTHYVFDSFAGLSAPGPHDGSYWEPGRFSCPEEIVAANLAGFERVVLMKGWIPTRFAEVSGTRFSFVHIDVDLEAPTRESVTFFYERMSPGGIILCDDYGFSTCPGATLAMDSFLADKAEKMIRLPGGGGFLVKGVATSAAAWEPQG